MNKVTQLQKSRLFEGLLPEEIEMLADLTQHRVVPPGELIFEQGDIGDCLYLLVAGSVEVLQQGADNSPHLIARLDAPSFFGEMSLVDKEFRSASIRTTAEAELLCLSNENLHSFARIYRNGFTLVVINIARVLSARLRETNQKLIAIS